MEIDISRPTFDAVKHFSSVLHLQGRALMDADLNEQALILLHQLRTAIADIVGPAARPANAPGFQIFTAPPTDKKGADLWISPGRCYVDGILVENEVGDPDPKPNPTWLQYSTQPDGYVDLTNDRDRLPDDKPFGVYLRVWERAITFVQDPAIRDIALGDLTPDTAARAKVIWQVAVMPLGTDAKHFDDTVLGPNLKQFNPRPGLLAARARRPLDADKDPCNVPPEAMYRGPENQLYRVEVHSGGQAWKGDVGETLGGATFMWSRENAAVVMPIEPVKGATVVLDTLGRDGKLDLEVGDWVEISDDAAASRVADDRALTGAPQPAAPLLQITAIDYGAHTITLSGPVTGDVGTHPALHPLVRRWDHTSPTLYGEPGGRAGRAPQRVNIASDGALPLIEGKWIALEDGVEVMFSSPDTKNPQQNPGTYRAGDYWMIPARTVTGDVEWPQDAKGPVSRAADGVAYYYAALAFVPAGPAGTPAVPSPSCTTFNPRFSA
jgi:hypothetical protein